MEQSSLVESRTRLLSRDEAADIETWIDRATDDMASYSKCPVRAHPLMSLIF